MTFLDSNVVIDLMEADAPFSAWSRAAVARARYRASLAVNMVVLAECAGQFATGEEQLRYFGEAAFDILHLTPDAAWRAGRAHRAYRRAGGERSAVLADFLIGGHAATLGAKLLTRDRQRFASYFPDLALTTPETHPNG